jgi:threonine synthase
MSIDGVIARHWKWLPVSESTPYLSLGEGNTPLVQARHLSAQLDADVRLKLEGCNPTGSFKDRGMVVAVAKAAEEGSKAVICASTGNTAASAAAYAAAAGLKAIVVVPTGKIALGKLAQAMIHGARVVAIEGNFDRALELVRQLAERTPVALVNSVNPYRIQGQKTAAFEVCADLGDAPDLLCLPVGNAGNITAYWKGFREYHAAGLSTRLPRMWGFQAAGAAPIVNGAPVVDPQTIATAIRIGNPASWQGAVAARDESGGLILSVTDQEILGAYHYLAAREGIFCEPASAAGVAGLLKLHAAGQLPAGSRVVCVLTGHGLKDPDTAMQGLERPMQVGADLGEIQRALGV